MENAYLLMEVKRKVVYFSTFCLRIIKFLPYLYAALRYRSILKMTPLDLVR